MCLPTTVAPDTAGSDETDDGVGRTVVWRFVDGKPGHEKQSAGLIQGVESIRPIEVHEIDVRFMAFFWRQIRRFLLRDTPDLPPPDLLVGVGHRTHLPLLLARLVCGGRSVVLMKPTLPLACFDLLFVPRHDRVRRKTNVIPTRGVICPTKVDDKETDTGLILLGGPSPHFKWSNRTVGDQVEAIIRETPEVVWQVCDSRRTPQGLGDYLPTGANALRHWRSLPADFLDNALAKAEYVWVSADSASMLYESLSAQARVGIIALEPKRRRNKHVRAIAELVASGHVSSSANGFRLDRGTDSAGFDPENRRCAQIVVERLLDP